jgi:hypothetical protein
MTKTREKETRPGAIYKIAFWSKVREKQPDEWAALINETNYLQGVKGWAASIIWFAYFRPPIEGPLSDMVDGCPGILFVSGESVLKLLADLNLNIELV